MMNKIKKGEMMRMSYSISQANRIVEFLKPISNRIIIERRRNEAICDRANEEKNAYVASVANAERNLAQHQLDKIESISKLVVQYAKVAPNESIKIFEKIQEDLKFLYVKQEKYSRKWELTKEEFRQLHSGINNLCNIKNRENLQNRNENFKAVKSKRENPIKKIFHALQIKKNQGKIR